MAVGCKKRPTGTTLTLFHAAKEGNIKQIKSFISKGADVNAMSENGMTPLHWASVLGFRDAAEILLDNGADLEAKNKDGWTPLKLASDHGQDRLAEFFISRGAQTGILSKASLSEKQKNIWMSASWKSKEGETAKEVLSRIRKKYIKSFEELEAEINAASKKQSGKRY